MHIHHTYLQGTRGRSGSLEMAKSKQVNIKNKIKRNYGCCLTDHIRKLLAINTHQFETHVKPITIHFTNITQIIQDRQLGTYLIHVCYQYYHVRYPMQYQIYIMDQLLGQQMFCNRSEAPAQRAANSQKLIKIFAKVLSFSQTRAINQGVFQKAKAQRMLFYYLFNKEAQYYLNCLPNGTSSPKSTVYNLNNQDTVNRPPEVTS